MKKKYKALMLDLDGTTIPNNFKGRPSEKVKDAIKKARTKIHVGIATSRPYFALNNLHKELLLSGPSVIDGGAQIMDFTTGKVYVEHKITKKDVESIYRIATDMNIALVIDEDWESFPISEENMHQTLGVFAGKLSNEKIADIFCERLAKIPTISTHKIVSWNKGFVDVKITHMEATKQQGIYEVAKILRIKTDEIIGVGDGYNDFPLLMACGLKVAMGNAVDELKAIADYIAPTVEQDGVADVIEKFIL